MAEPNPNKNSNATAPPAAAPRPAAAESQPCCGTCNTIALWLFIAGSIILGLIVAYRLWVKLV
jgi:hypothetical protein